MSNVPDYRGMFLRGHGSQTFNTQGYGNVNHASEELGVIQGDSIRELGTKGQFAGSPVHNAPQPDYGVFKAIRSTQGYLDLGSRKYRDVRVYEMNLANAVPVDNENRPINKAVKYLIRAK